MSFAIRPMGKGAGGFLVPTAITVSHGTAPSFADMSDGNFSNGWGFANAPAVFGTTTAFIRYDFGAAVTVTALTWAATTQNNGTSNVPNGFNLQSSSNGSTWSGNIAMNGGVTNLSGSSTTAVKTWLLVSPTTARYFRLVKSAIYAVVPYGFSELYFS